MSELTKELFEAQIKNLATKDDIKEAISEVVLAVKAGFDDADKKLSDIEDRLDRVEHKVDRALYQSIDRHERWINEIAAKVGLTLSAR